jgi:hypothetical protein
VSKGAAVIYCKVIAWHLPEGTEENHRNLRIAGYWAEILTWDILDTEAASVNTHLFSIYNVQLLIPGRLQVVVIAC